MITNFMAFFIENQPHRFLLCVILLINLTGLIVVDGLAHSKASFLSKDGVFRDNCFQWRSKVIDSFPDKRLVTLPEELSHADGSLGRDIPVTYHCESFEADRLSYLRLLRFEGAGFNVFNFVALPRLCFDIPILGIDIVSLPGGNLCSIDFQPIQNNDNYFSKPIYEDARKFLSKWQRVLPPGGDFMPAAAKYFSPIALWTRFPHSDSQSIFFLISQAIDEYLSVYTDNLSISGRENDEQAMASRRQGLVDYLAFRTQNDPAKNILFKAFGEQWTKAALSDVVFPSSFVK